MYRWVVVFVLVLAISSCQTFQAYLKEQEAKNKQLFGDIAFIDWIESDLLPNLQKIKQTDTPFTVSKYISSDYVEIKVEYIRAWNEGIEVYEYIPDFIYKEYKNYIDSRGGYIKAYKSPLSKIADDKFFNFDSLSKRSRTYRGRKYYPVYIGVINKEPHSMLVGFVQYKEILGGVFHGYFYFISKRKTKEFIDSLPNQVFKDYEAMNF